MVLASIGMNDEPAINMNQYRGASHGKALIVVSVSKEGHEIILTRQVLTLNSQDLHT